MGVESDHDARQILLIEEYSDSRGSQRASFPKVPGATGVPSCSIGSRFSRLGPLLCSRKFTSSSEAKISCDSVHSYSAHKRPTYDNCLQHASHTCADLCGSATALPAWWPIYTLHLAIRWTHSKLRKVIASNPRFRSFGKTQHLPRHGECNPNCRHHQLVTAAQSWRDNRRKR